MVAYRPVDCQRADIHAVIAEFRLIREAGQACKAWYDKPQQFAPIIIDRALIIPFFRPVAAGANSNQSLVQTRKRDACSGRVGDLKLCCLLCLFKFTVFPLTGDSQVIGRIPRKLQAYCLVIAFGTVLVSHDIIQEAIDLIATDSNPSRQPIGNRTRQDACNFLFAIIAVQAADHAFYFLGRLGGDHVNSATNGVFAEQDTLRSAQDFHALKVHKWRARQLVSAHVDAVLEHGY